MSPGNECKIEFRQWLSCHGVAPDYCEPRAEKALIVTLSLETLVLRSLTIVSTTRQCCQGIESVINYSLFSPGACMPVGPHWMTAFLDSQWVLFKPNSHVIERRQCQMMPRE